MSNTKWAFMQKEYNLYETMQIEIDTLNFELELRDKEIKQLKKEIKELEDKLRIAKINLENPG